MKKLIFLKVFNQREEDDEEETKNNFISPLYTRPRQPDPHLHTDKQP